MILRVLRNSDVRFPERTPGELVGLAGFEPTIRTALFGDV